MMIMRKTIFLIFAVLFLAIPASAVLNEKNLGQTLAVLREELEMYQRDSRRSIVMGQAIRERIHKHLMEIMNEDGTMARLPQLMEVSKKFGIKIITIKDLIAY